MTLLDLDTPAPTIMLCELCHQPLWAPESRKLRLGPDCAEKLGLAPAKPRRITRVPSWRDCEGQIDLLAET